MATISCDGRGEYFAGFPLQISAANLLLAGQQTQRAAQTPVQPAGASTAAKPEFAALDFKRAPEQSGEVTPAPKAAVTPAAGQSYTRPGSQLDIRV